MRASPVHASALARPEPGGKMSDGVVVEADVLARLFGLRLLRLHARVVVTPARITPVPGVVTSRDPFVPGPGGAGVLDDAVTLLSHASRTRADAKRKGIARRTGLD